MTTPGEKYVPLTDRLMAYVRAHSAAPGPVERRLIARTAERLGGRAVMQIPAEQGALLTLLARLTRPRFAVEVGTFTGYSSMCLARGLADGGRLLCCDVSEEWTALAREAWAEAGLADRIDLRIAPAADTLRALPAEPHVDLAFIDADKGGYIGYWEALIPRMRPNGLVIADNVLYGGNAADPAATGVAADIHRFNEHVGADPRVEAVMLTVADGVTLARVR